MSSPASKIAKKLASNKSDDALQTIERLLPSGATDADRAALRAKPELYKQYLDALDTQYGTRSERAKNLGFGDRTWYHGTNQSLDKFDLKKVGQGSGEKGSGQAAWFTDSPGVADEFAQTAAENHYITGGNKSAIDWDKDQRLFEEFQKAEKAGNQKLADRLDQQRLDMRNNGQQIVPVKLREDTLANQRFSDKLSNTTADERAAYLSRNKFVHQKDGTIFENITDSPNGTKSTVAGVLKPENIRSTNAAFDPRFKDSADILAFGGRQAPKIAAKMLKPHMNLGDAFSSITEPIATIDKPMNDATEWVGKQISNQTNIVPQAARSPTTQYAENIKSNVIDNALGFVAPTPSSLLLGKTMPLLKAAKGSQIAERMIVPPKSAAQVYQELRAADKASKFGHTILVEPKPQGLGNVKVIDTPKVPNGKVTVVD